MFQVLRGFVFYSTLQDPFFPAPLFSIMLDVVGKCSSVFGKHDQVLGSLIVTVTKVNLSNI